MKLIAESFAWPWSGGRRSAWIFGLLAVVLLPISFIPLLGYSMAATRAAIDDPSAGPPGWIFGGRLFWDGAWIAFDIAVLTAPFALLFSPMLGGIDALGLWHTTDPALGRVYSGLLTGYLLALPWGIALLILVPHTARRFALSGRPADLFDYRVAAVQIRRNFARWNLVAAAMVTGWALGVAGVGLLCVGLIPGVFYAILVSAHACAALQDPDPSTR